MTEEEKKPPTSIDVGGDVTDGSVIVGNGNIVAKDKVIQNIQNVNLDVGKIIEMLRNSLPQGDPTPQYFLTPSKAFNNTMPCSTNGRNCIIS